MNDSQNFCELDYPNTLDDHIDHSLIDIGNCLLPLEGHPRPFYPSPASETMDIACQPNSPIEFKSSKIMDFACQPSTGSEFPFSPRGPPERATFPGSLNFCVEVNSKDVHKKTFLYSHRLCRIYVDMKCNFSVQFNWNYLMAPHMFVRSTVVFSDETQAEKRVERCVQHTVESSASCTKREIVKNVLHSSREIGTQGVYYCGNADMADSWYSVLVEFMRSGPDPCSHAYQFSCKNSCATGINRRAIAIIFTLEDKAGVIYGRQKVGARVCACPRRDMHKDELAEGVYKSGKKRIPSNQIEQPKTKKIKVENLMEFDDTVLTLPPLKIVGSRATLCGLKMMLEMMELAVECRRNDPDVAGHYEKPIADLKEAIKKLEKDKTPLQ